MLLEVFIIQKGTSFLLIRRAFTKKEIQMDGSLFSGMISAISLFTNELQMGEIQFFETKNNRILIHPVGDIITVGIVEEKKEDEFVVESLKKIGGLFWTRYAKTLANWNGDTNLFLEFPPAVDEIVYQEFSHYYLEREFPKHLIHSIREFQEKFEPHILRYIGRMVGTHRVQLQKTNSPKVFRKGFSKALQKELNLFSICSITEESTSKWIFQMEICPICRGIYDPHFSCDFTVGFIDGFVNNVVEKGKFSVIEVECSAQGNKNCVFEIRRLA